MDSQAQKVSQFELEFKKLNNTVESLQQLVERLESRISIACAPPAPRPISSDKNAQSVHLKAPIAEQVSNVTCRVESVCDTLTEIHERLEI